MAENYGELNILTDEDLLKMAQEGSQGATEWILNKYKPLVIKATDKYTIGGFEKEDLIQEGMIGLFMAVMTYKKDAGAKFKTYATNCVANRMKNLLEHAGTQSAKTMDKADSLDAPISDDDGEGATLKDTLAAPISLETEEMAAGNILWQLLISNSQGTFTDLQHKILLAKIQGFPNAEIAEKLGIREKTVANAMQKVREKLKQYMKE